MGLAKVTEGPPTFVFSFKIQIRYVFTFKNFKILKINTENLNYPYSHKPEISIIN